MPRAPPMRIRETVVVPRDSNLAKPYGYRAEGGLRDSFQHIRTTKSPRRSGWMMGFWSDTRINIDGEEWRGYVPLMECPASASNDAECMYHPAAPFATVNPTFEKSPISVIWLPLSPNPPTK